MAAEKIRVGCCGFPKSKRVYFENFNTVELQNTFYTLPRADLLERLRREAPEGFEFSIKVCQLITHLPTSPTYKKTRLPLRNPERYGFFKPTKEVFSVWQEALRQAQILGSRVLVFQSPPSFRPEPNNIKNLYKFFETIDRQGLSLCWESRGAWPKDQVKKICRELDIIDSVDPLVREPVWGKIFYFRLHGGKDYRKKYSDEDLRSVKRMVKGEEGYILLNNIYMFDDSIRMKEILKDDA